MEEELRATVKAEGVEALAFIPLVVDDRLIGKFMAYYDTPHEWTEDELELALTMARQLALAIARKRDEHALRESEQRLEQAMLAGRMGAWQWNPRSGRVRWSPGLERIHGLDPATFGGTFEDFQRDIHPEDRAAMQAAMERALREAGSYHISYRIRRPDGEMRWVMDRGQVERNPAGKALRVIGVLLNVGAFRAASPPRRSRPSRIFFPLTNRR